MPQSTIRRQRGITGKVAVFSEYSTAEELLREIKPGDQEVFIMGFQSETLPKLPDTVMYLNISGNLFFGIPSNLKYIEDFPANLQNLFIKEQNLAFLSALPKLPASIETFIIDNMSIEPKVQMEIYRQTLGVSKPRLDCKKCYFAAIEKVIQPTDYEVRIEEYQEKGFPRLPSTVKKLEIHRGLPDTVYKLPSELKEFDCYSNNMRALPRLPDSLNYLNCSSNPLGRLPPLPTNLIELICARCELRSLPKLPDSLIKINCMHNKLTSFPDFPPKLRVVMATENQISQLPKMRRFTMEDAQKDLFIEFDGAFLRHPFRTFYREFRQAQNLAENQNNVNAVNAALVNNLNYLADRIEAYYAITSTVPKGMKEREENIKNRLEHVERIQQTLGQAGPLPVELAAAVGSFYSDVGNLGSRSLNQQVTTLRQRLPEYQPVGVSQKPFLAPWQQRKQNSNTRARLRKLMREEKNIQRNAGTGGKRKTRRLRRKN